MRVIIIYSQGGRDVGDIFTHIKGEFKKKMWVMNSLTQNIDKGINDYHRRCIRHKFFINNFSYLLIICKKIRFVLHLCPFIILRLLFFPFDLFLSPPTETTIRQHSDSRLLNWDRLEKSLYQSTRKLDLSVCPGTWVSLDTKWMTRRQRKNFGNC